MTASTFDIYEAIDAATEFIDSSDAMTPVVPPETSVEFLDAIISHCNTWKQTIKRAVRDD